MSLPTSWLGRSLPHSLPPAPLSSRQTFTTSKRQMQTQSKPAIAIAPILPSVTEKKVARGRRDAAPPEDGKETERHRLEKQLGGSCVGAGDDYACSNERTWSTGGPRGGRRDHRKAGVSAVCEMTALTLSSPVVAQSAAAFPLWLHRKWIRGKREEERIDSIFIKKMLSRQLEIGRVGVGWNRTGRGQAEEKGKGRRRARRTLRCLRCRCLRSIIA